MNLADYNNPPKPRILIAALLSLMCVGIILWISGELFESALGYTWPQVTGKVVSSEVRSTLMETTKTKYLAYWPEVQYEYKVGTVRYSGNRVRFTQHGMDEAESKRVVTQYPVGKAVPVYYNPNDPEAAVLEKGIYWRMLVVLFLAMILAPSYFAARALSRLPSS